MKEAKRTGAPERGAIRIYEEAEGYRLHFHFDGKQVRQLFKDEQEAEAVRFRAEPVLRAMREGLVRLPAGVSIKEFVLSGGKVDTPLHDLPPAATRPTRPTPSSSPPRPSIGELMTCYTKTLALPNAGEGQSARTGEHALLVSTRKTELVHLKHLRGFLERGRLVGRRVDEIGPQVLLDFRASRLKRVLPTTVNKELVTYGKLFDVALAQGHVTKNPLDEIEPLPEDEHEPLRTLAEIEEYISRGVFSAKEQYRIRRACYLLDGEVVELLEHVRKVSETAFVPVAIAAYTGGRKGEIARLTWADVDLRANRITLKSYKQSRKVRLVSRTIDLHPDLVPILVAHGARNGQKGFLFPSPVKGRRNMHVNENPLHDALVRAVKKTRFAHVRYHTLRHSFGSNLRRAGVDREVIMELMGHTTDEMFRLYQHVAPHEKKDVLAQVYRRAPAPVVAAPPTEAAGPSHDTSPQAAPTPALSSA